MTDSIIVSDLILEHLPVKNKKTRSGISFNCPMCVISGEPRLDTKMRGGLKINNDGSFVYHCFNCKFSTGHTPNGYLSKKCMQFLKTLGVPDNKIPFQLRFAPIDPSASTAEPASIDIENKITFDSIKLPYGCKTIQEHIIEKNNDIDFINALNYIKSRGSWIADNSQYYWTPFKKYSLNKRIIIPFYYNNNIVGWTGRYTSNNVPETLGKYYSEVPPNYMYNMDLLDSDTESVILVEGIFDAIAIDGIAALGNQLNALQVDLLKKSGKRIIVVPDRNAAGMKLVEQAIQHGFHVSVPENSSNVDDLAEAVKRFGVLYTLEKIYENTFSDPDTVRMKFNVLKL